MTRLVMAVLVLAGAAVPAAAQPIDCQSAVAIDAAGKYDPKTTANVQCQAGGTFTVQVCNADTKNKHTVSVKSTMKYNGGQPYKLLKNTVNVSVGVATGSPTCKSASTTFFDARHFTANHIPTGSYKYDVREDGTDFDPDLDVSIPPIAPGQRGRGRGGR